LSSVEAAQKAAWPCVAAVMPHRCAPCACHAGAAAGSDLIIYWISVQNFEAGPDSVLRIIIHSNSVSLGGTPRGFCRKTVKKHSIKGAHEHKQFFKM
jgi:hypothetical protein